MSESNSTTQDEFALQSPPSDCAAERKAKEAAYQKAWRETHKEELRAYRKAYYQANKEKVDAQNDAWNKANPEKDRAYKRAYSEANKEKAKAHYQANKEKIAVSGKARYAVKKYRMNAQSYANHLRRRYGLTMSQRDEMIRASGNRCQCCKVPFSEIVGKRPSIDHCHKTGVVRGILCDNCNWLIGHAFDDPKILRAAADYLDRTKP